MEQNAKSCVVIGSTPVDILCCHNELTDAVIHLVTNLGIRHFFNDNQSLFQSLFVGKASVAKMRCKDKVTLTYIMYKQLKPEIKITTYYNDLNQKIINAANNVRTSKKGKFILPLDFDDCIYLPEKRMYTKNSIMHSAKRIAEIVDYVLVGTEIENEGHHLTLDWADKLGKPIIKLSDICPKILTADIKKYRSPIDEL